MHSNYCDNNLRNRPIINRNEYGNFSIPTEAVVAGWSEYDVGAVEDGVDEALWPVALVAAGVAEGHVEGHLAAHDALGGLLKKQERIENSVPFAR